MVEVRLDRSCPALILAVSERGAVDPAQGVVGLLLWLGRGANFNVLPLALSCGASGCQKHSSHYHQNKGDPA